MREGGQWPLCFGVVISFGFQWKIWFFASHVCCLFSPFLISPDLDIEWALLIVWFENDLGFVDLPAVGGVLRGYVVLVESGLRSSFIFPCLRLDQAGDPRLSALSFYYAAASWPPAPIPFLPGFALLVQWGIIPMGSWLEFVFPWLVHNQASVSSSPMPVLTFVFRHRFWRQQI
jgi:hypothetical protein